MNLFKKIKWFTLQEILNLKTGGPVAPFDSATSASWFTTMMTSNNIALNYVGLKSKTDFSDAKINLYVDALMNVVYNRFYNEYIYKKERECFPVCPPIELTPDDFRPAMNKLFNVLCFTAPKYIPILYQYDENYEKLFNKLESESNSFNRFNDTPENIIDNLDFMSEDYATNMGRTQSNSKVDSNSVAGKLKEIQENFKSIILEWANEFDRIFIDEYQLED